MNRRRTQVAPTAARTAVQTAAKLAATALTASVLASCAGTEARTEATDAHRHAQTLYDQGPNIAEVIQSKITDRPDFGTHAERDRHGQPFPTVWETPGITFNPGVDPISAPMTLLQFVDRLRLQLRIPVILDLAPPQALGGSGSGGPAMGANTPAPNAPSTAPGIPGASPIMARDAATASNDPLRRLVDDANQSSQGGASAGNVTTAQFVPFGASGSAAGPDPATCKVTFPERVMPLSRRLLFVDSTCGVRSTYDGQRIVIRRYVEELLPLAAFSGKDDFKVGVGGSGSNGGSSGGAGGTGSAGGSNGSSSGGSSGSGSQSASGSWSADVYSEVTDGIRARIPKDALVMPSPAANGITVVAPPDALDRARDYVDNFNKTASRQISVRIEVLETSINNSDSFGSDVTLAIKDRWSKLNFAGTGVASNTSAEAGCITAGVPTTGFFNAVKDIAGTSFTACALAKEGIAKVLDSRSFIVPNGGTFILDESLLNDYVSGGSAGQTTTAGTVVSGSVQTSTTFSGTKLIIQPALLPDGVVRMRYQPIIQGKPTFVAAGGSADFVQLRRDQSVRTFKQEVSVQNGSTIVAYAAKGEDASTDDAGFGSPRIPLFGGRNSGTKSSRAFVILITPTERDSLGRAPTR